MAENLEKIGRKEKAKEFFHNLRKKMTVKKKSGGQGSIPKQAINPTANTAAAAPQPAAVAGSAAASAMPQGSIPPSAAPSTAAAVAAVPAAIAPAPVALAAASAAAAPAPDAAAAAPAEAEKTPEEIAAEAEKAAAEAAEKAAADAAAKAAAKAAEEARRQAIMIQDYDTVNLQLQSPENNDADHGKSNPSISKEAISKVDRRMTGVLEALDGATVSQDTQGAYAKLYGDVQKYNQVMQGDSISYEECRTLLTNIQLQSRVIADLEGADASLKSVASEIAEARVPGELTYISPEILGIDMKARAEPEGAGGKIARHLMSFSIRVKYPNLHIRYNDGSLGGIHLGYWEEILMQYNFDVNGGGNANIVEQNITTQNGGFIKGWNNIYDMLPGSITFNPSDEHKKELSDQYGADKDMSGLNNLMKEGAAGNLQGEREILFLDRPGIGYSKMEPGNLKQSRSYANRTLNFRVAVNNDAGQRKELFCSQSIVINNSNVISLQMNHGASAAGVNISNEAGMAEGGGIANFIWQRHIPTEALTAVPGFAESAIKGTAQPFDQLEYNGARNLIGIESAKLGDPVQDGDDEKIWEGDKSPYGDILKFGARGAGAIGLARPRNGDRLYQMSLGIDEWMFVAITNASRLTHLYFSDGKTQMYTGRSSNTAGNRHQIDMRSYFEIPVELYYDNTLQKAVGQQAEQPQPAVTSVHTVAAGAPQQPAVLPLSASKKLGYLQVSIDGLMLKKFKRDSEYQKIGKLALQYNASLSGPPDAALAIRKELSQAAVTYLHKHSFGGRAKADRQEKIVNLIMQLTMTKGAKQKALENISLIGEDQMTVDTSGDANSATARGVRNIKSFFTRAIDEEGEVVAKTEPKSTEDFSASPALRAVAISTLSLLEMKEEADGFRRTIATLSGPSTSPMFDEGGRKYTAFGFKSQSQGNTERADYDILGSALHEMTHAADDNVYNSQFTLGVDMSKSKEEIKAESQRRLKDILHLRKKHAQDDMVADDDISYELLNRIKYGGLEDKQRVSYTTTIMQKWKSRVMDTFTPKKQVLAQKADYDKMDKIRQMTDEDTELNLTTFNEYDAILPQMLSYLEAKGADKTHPELYRKIRAMVLDTTMQRMNASDTKKLNG